MIESTLAPPSSLSNVVIAPPVIIGEQRVRLRGVSWSTYKALSKELGDERTCRLAFDSGELEIMSPFFKHGKSEFSLGQIVVVLTEEFGLDYCPAGQLKCEREDLQKAIEPDGCFYIQHFKDVASLDDIDLKIHPPPDLMIEVDISTNSLNKLPICAALGVPEHWRYDGKCVEIRLLTRGRYIPSEESAIFPGIPLRAFVPEYLNADGTSHSEKTRRFRTRVRDELRKLSANRIRKRRKP